MSSAPVVKVVRKHTGTGCLRGKRYADKTDAKLAWVNGLRHGRRANGYYHCDRCNGYHVGSPKVKGQKCWATAKIIYVTKDDAWDAVRDFQARGREESGVYVCKYCDFFHTTSHPH